MYDFEGDRADDRAAPTDGHAASNGPHAAWMVLELPRLVGELASSFAIDVVAPRRPSGDGRPVLVIPGFQATDPMTARLRGHLERHDFRAHGWGQGANIGLTDERIDGLVDRFEEIRKTYDEPVSVVGWSFGGVLARWLAHTYPGDVRQIVCLGSPWRAEGERTRATGMFERSRAKHGISDRAKPMVELLRGPVPVPTTAVYSVTDGIVPWRGCAVDASAAPVAENVVVPSSHLGMVANPLVLDVVVDRLCQDPENWHDFSWRNALQTKWGRA
ncbi:alpha/beta hydrolase [Nocardioides humilatus]|uniref:Alpha/beta hydrolase n=1 Tax=Nocardioides humilatus TaxID=2607660 RepID=A0A5B1LMG5_9ACTN|nr:alpha/beta fold hydrolase [Nocardioides humilatus]KAA1421704.1 alpha/beta hydrolase [Nocardioides humilatus]